MLDKIVSLIYDLLNEYDINLWRDIEYIDLAEMWCNIIDSGTLEENKIKESIKNFYYHLKVRHRCAKHYTERVLLLSVPHYS